MANENHFKREALFEEAVTLQGTTTVSGSLIPTGSLAPTGSVDLSGASAFTGAVGAMQTATVTLTNAQILALRAAPITVVAAPGAGKWVQVLGGCLINNYTGAYTESADNLALRYVNGSGSKASADIEMTGFADATADEITNILPLAALTTQISAAGELSNALVCIHNTGDGEFGGGNAGNSWKVIVDYVVRTTSL